LRLNPGVRQAHQDRAGEHEPSPMDQATSGASLAPSAWVPGAHSPCAGNRCVVVRPTGMAELLGRNGVSPAGHSPGGGVSGCSPHWILVALSSPQRQGWKSDPVPTSGHSQMVRVASKHRLSNKGLHQTGRQGVAFAFRRWPVVEGRPAGEAPCCTGTT
jgi:hypothetical protein